MKKRKERQEMCRSVAKAIGIEHIPSFESGVKWADFNPNWREDIPKKEENQYGLPKLYLCQILTLDMTFGYRYSYRVGFINKEGVMVIRPQFDDAASFSEGIAAIKVGDLWGYIDKTGKTIIAPQFIEAGIFQDGIAIVKDENGYAAINKRGIKLSDHLSTSQQASDRKALNRKYVVYGIHLEEEHRVEHIKHIHHLLLIIFAVLASLVEFCTFKYFHGWGWAFVPLVVNAVFTAYRIIVINETYKDDFNMYEFALTFVPIILINIAAFRWSNGWSLAILIPSLLLSIGVSELVHDNL